MSYTQSSKRRRTGRSRSGAALIELAVCVPVLMVLAIGTIETTDVVFLRQIAKSAAYEGARSATAPGQTAATAFNAANQSLQMRNITSGQVSVSPTVTVSTQTGTEVTFTVKVPVGANSCLMQPFVLQRAGAFVVESVTMIRQ
jgi:Flp pilus assembly protein TadG